MRFLVVGAACALIAWTGACSSIGDEATGFATDGLTGFPYDAQSQCWGAATSIPARVETDGTISRGVGWLCAFSPNNESMMAAVSSNLRTVRAAGWRFRMNQVSGPAIGGGALSAEEEAFCSRWLLPDVGCPACAGVKDPNRRCAR